MSGEKDHSKERVDACEGGKRSRVTISSNSNVSSESSTTHPNPYLVEFTPSPILKRILPDSFALGAELAKVILRSQTFEEAFVRLVPDTDKEKFMEMLSCTYTVDLLSNKSDVTAYAVVYRLTHPTTIFFNPLLFLNMIRNESSPEISSQCSLFIAIKLVHEVSHLLHYTCSQALQSSQLKITQPKILQEKVLDCSNIVEKKMEFEVAVKYKDLGELIEKEIFGGMIEAKFSNNKNYMDLEQMAVYGSKLDRYGYFVDCGATISNIRESKSFQIVRGNEFLSGRTKSFHTVALPLHLSGVHRRPAAYGDIDVREGRHDELDNENMEQEASCDDDFDFEDDEEEDFTTDEYKGYEPGDRRV